MRDPPPDDEDLPLEIVVHPDEYPINLSPGGSRHP